VTPSATPPPAPPLRHSAPRPAARRGAAAATAERSSIRTRRALSRLGAGATLGACALLGYVVFAGRGAPPAPGAAPAPNPAAAAAAAVAPGPAPVALAAPPPPVTALAAGDSTTVAPATGEPAAPPPPACTANIESVPRATVLLDGKALGRTPLQAAPVPCGASALVLAHPRYRKLRQTLNASPDAPAAVNARLVRLGAQLRLSSKPAGATFKVNGREVGRAPLKLELERFETVNIQASLPGRKPWRRKVYLRTPVTKVEAALTGDRRRARR
jgi:hypothetical protein